MGDSRQETIGRRGDASTERVVQPVDAKAQTVHTGPSGAAALGSSIPATQNEIDRTGPHQSLEGRLVGRYRIVRLISHGGMGSVYLATDPHMDRTVALKICRVSSSDPEADRQRFRAEITSVARLRHPNIVAILDSGETGGVNYFTMEYIEGITFGDYCREFAPPFRLRAQIVRDTAEAVQHAHEQGVLHRDIKPGNIIIDAQARPHITDFGLAKQLGTDLNLTLSGEAIGTPNYMPPEQASGQQGLIGFHSDIWGLGAVLYEALTLRPPFKGETAHDVLLAVIERQPIRPREHVMNVPRELETICLKCLEKDYRRRYRSALDLAADLNRFIQGVPIHARPPSLLYRGWKFATRHRSLVSLAGLLGLLLLVLVLVLVGQRQRQQSAWQPLPPTLTFVGGLPEHVTCLRADLRGPGRPPVTDHLGIGLEDGAWLWLQRTREPQDVRVEVDLIWSAMPDHLQICLNADRDRTDPASGLPRGYLATIVNSLDGICSIRRVQDDTEILRQASVSDHRTGIARVIFQRRGATLEIYHNGDLVCAIDDLLPLGGEVHDGIGLRTFHPQTRIRAVRAFRRPLPELSSPLLAADSRTSIGQWRQAADQYLTIQRDYPASDFAPEALAKAYLTALRAGDEALATTAAGKLDEDWPTSPFRGHVLWDQCRRRWLQGKQLDALDHAAELLKIDPASRILEFLLRHRRLPLLAPTRERLFALLPSSTAALDLDLAGLGLTDLDFLRGMRLRRLDVSRNELRDLEPLRDCGLESLDCSRNQIFDLTPVCQRSLKILDCSYNPIRSLAPLADTSLAQLDAVATAITDLTGIAALPLTILDLSHTDIVDDAPLRGLRLRTLRLAGTRIDHLSGLRLADLVELDIAGCQVVDLRPLAHGSLRVLNLAATPVADLAPLAGLPLERFDASHTAITDLTPLAEAPLRALDLGHTPVHRLAPLSHLPLVWLDLRSTRVDDLAPLADLPLTTLDLADTPISDLTPLARLPLEQLNLAGTPVVDLTPLAQLPVIELDLTETAVTDLAPLADLRLQELRLDHSQVANLTPLATQMLLDFSCAGTPVSDLTPLSPRGLRSLNAAGAPLHAAGSELLIDCPYTIFDPGVCTPAFLAALPQGARPVPLTGDANLATILAALAANRWTDLRQQAPTAGGRQYLLLPLSVTRLEATAIATASGATLVTIDSAAELAFVTATFGPLPIWVRFANHQLMLEQADAANWLPPRRDAWQEHLELTGAYLHQGRWHQSAGRRLVVLEWAEP